MTIQAPAWKAWLTEVEAKRISELEDEINQLREEHLAQLEPVMAHRAMIAARATARRQRASRTKPPPKTQDAA